MAQISTRELAEWFETHAGAMCLYVRQWLDADGARDVVQDVFVRLAAGGRRPEYVRAWLFRSVRNAAINELRSRRRREKHTEAVGAERQTWFEPDPAGSIDAESAAAALKELDNDLREVVTLRIWGGLTLAEAADVLGTPISTLHSRYVSALAELRRRLRK